MIFPDGNFSDMTKKLVMSKWIKNQSEKEENVRERVACYEK
jgi:hypothetical protein